MALSIFDDKAKPPAPEDIDAALGRSSGAWWELIDYIQAEYPPVEEKWNYFGAKYGWSLRLVRKKRVILYMIPCSKYFKAAFVLGEKAYQKTKEARLPGEVQAIIDEAPKYAEGRGFRLDIKAKKELGAIRKLAAIKMS